MKSLGVLMCSFISHLSTLLATPDLCRISLYKKPLSPILYWRKKRNLILFSCLNDKHAST